MSRTRYLLPLLSATALTSVSFNLLVFKRDAKVERERLEAQTSILESLVSRLKKGEKIGEEEVERLVGLARRGGVEGDEEGGRSRIMKGEERVGWREAFMGRKGLNKSDGGSGSEEDGFDLSKLFGDPNPTAPKPVHPRIPENASVLLSPPPLAPASPPRPSPSSTNSPPDHVQPASNKFL